MDSAASTNALPSPEQRFNFLLRRAVALPFVLLLATAIFMTWASSRVLSLAGELQRADQTIGQAEQCLTLGVDMETGIRGFQLTGNDVMLQPYSEARKAVDAAFANLENIVETKTQRERLQRARDAQNEWLAFGEDLIARRRAGADTQSMSLNLRGKELFDRTRARFLDFITGEEQLKREKTEEFQSTNQRVHVTRILLLLCIGAGLGLYTRRQMEQVATMFRASEAAARREAEFVKTQAQQLLEARNQLEDRVAERTRDLNRALEKAKEVDRLKSEFLATMSHELRTPLNSILGFTEVVLAEIPGELNAEQKRQLTFVQLSATLLLHLINDLLDLARIESGRMQPVIESVSPAVVINEAISTIRPLADRKGLTLNSELDVPPTIRTDRKMLFQVLLNLLANAVKFTQRGEIKLSSRTEGDTLVTSVQDTGIGIKAEQMHLLFEAFRQIDGSAQRRYEGTGLGLYLCRRIMKLLGGKIDASSEAGRGSVFTFTLPLNP